MSTRGRFNQGDLHQYSWVFVPEASPLARACMWCTPLLRAASPAWPSQFRFPHKARATPARVARLCGPRLEDFGDDLTLADDITKVDSYEQKTVPRRGNGNDIAFPHQPRTREPSKYHQRSSTRRRLAHNTQPGLNATAGGVCGWQSNADRRLRQILRNAPKSGQL